jgi:hypothetical protein
LALHQIEDDLPELADPVLVAALDGWVDAAGAASGAAERIARRGSVVARFDGDLVFDYRSRRPVLDVVDGVLSRLAWPELVLRHVRVEGRDLLFLVGAEPDARWQALGADIVGLARRLGVVEWISLGAVPAAVAHTRRVPIMATASRDGLLRHGEVRGPSGVLRVPAAALSTFEMAMVAGGTPAVGFFAQVPPYAGSGYAAASVALLERLGRHLEVDLSDADLEQTSRREIAGYDAAVAGDSDTREMVARLEAMGEDAESEEQRIPSGDELASEIQRYLREQAGDDGPGPGFPGA